MSLQALRNSTTVWRETDTRHHLHPFTDFQGLAEEGGSRIITRAEGVWLEDSEGQRILDGMSGLWCVNVGYGRERLAKAAYDQMVALPYYNTFFKTATPPSIELSEKLAELTPAGLNRVFYASSGSEANDTLARIVRRYWKLVGQPERRNIISRTNGYHGSTMAAASLGGMQPMHALDDLPLPGFHHVRQPYFFGEGGDLSPEDFGLAAAKAIEDKILELGPETVAAFIGEPIQGAGGVVIPPQSYWPEVQRICREYDVLLIADEVICGFGRTGHWFGSNLFGIEPDLMTLAKGITSGYLPLSAAMVGDRVAEVLRDKGGEFAHGFTYSGHPVACAVALENIAIIEEEKLVERVHDDTGPYLQERLATLADHPLVGEVRGVGFLGAVELVADKPSRAGFKPKGRAGTLCRDHCFEIGVISRAVGDTMVVAPPLILTREEADELVQRLGQALDKTAADLNIA
ncbi:aspartate aminotransferase family protein [Pelagibius sp.]|uniref:aspartate aminotransferase family protein n=1 Tax=Pelagibius sp. TaxID=1931238 RepID=UPI00260C45B3|nr:aspartate aminotransferase family protein [Pelagibius sp.]